MRSLIELVNTISGWLIDQLVEVSSPLGPEGSLITISLLLGVLLLWIYGKVSFQKRIKMVKRQISSSLLEAIIFRHDLRSSLAAQLGMLKGGAHYFILAVPPLIILAVPCILALAQLNLWYNWRGLGSGDRAVVEIEGPTGALSQLALKASPGITSSQSVHIVDHSGDDASLAWGLKFEDGVKIDSESSSIEVLGLEKPIQKILVTGDSFEKIKPVESRSGWLKFLYPDDNLLGKSAASSLKVQYPERNMSILGFHMHWVVIFFLFSLASGLVASRYMGVEI